MIKTRGKLRSTCEVIFCFLTSAIIAVAALNIGLKTEPGKILPTGLSMRNGEMSKHIIRGIELALDDLEIIRSGKANADIWRMLTFVHVDPFFYLALILPQAASKTILMIGYFLRFGLCSVAMFHFLSRHLKLSGLFSALLSVMYAFSSQIVMTAQFASVMNMAVMMPVVMSAFDSYLQKRTWKDYAVSGVAAFGLIVSGGFGATVGMPAMILIGLLMCISLYRSFKLMITSWFKILSTIVFGFGLAAAFVIPGLLAMNIDVDVVENFKNARVTYTFFEMIRGTFLLRSGSIYQNTAPLFYVGLLTLAGVIAFALNEMIPLRLKVTAAVIAMVFHISCCSSFVNETLSIFGAAPVLNSSKLICLEIIVFFMAGIGLKNIRGLGRGDHIALCFIPLFFLIISGNSTSGTSLASPIVISTFLGIIMEAALIYTYAKGRMSRGAKIAVLFIVYFFVGVNTAFIMFNNTIQKKAVEEYFTVNNGAGTSESLIYDRDFVFPVLNDTDDYLIVPADLRTYEPGYSVIDDMNYLSIRISGRQLFEEIFLSPSDKREFRQEGNDTYLLNPGPNTIAFSPFTVEQGERLFIYCDADNGAAVGISNQESSNGRAFTGPFFTEIENISGELTLELIIDSEGEDACRISLYKIDEDAMNALMSLSGNAGVTGFRIDTAGIDGISTIIFPYNYDDTRIRINGTSCHTFEFCGRLAAVFAGNGAEMDVSVDHKSSVTGLCILISAVAAFCLVAIPLLQRYNEKKTVTGEGTDKHA